MSSNKYKRRGFFEKILNKDVPQDPDPLFKKYSRKNLGNRTYSSYDAFIQGIDHPQTPGTHEEGDTAERVGNVTSGLLPYTGTWTEQEVMHLLKRAGFGVLKADVDSLVVMTPSAAVDTLLTYGNTPTLPSAAPLNYYHSIYADPTIPLGSDWTANNLTYAATSPNDGSVNAYRINSLVYWSWGVWLNEGSRIREKMVNFWYHFIPINLTEINDLVNNSATLGQDYLRLLRTNAMGNVKTLIKAIAKMPAMLIYLGNHYSTASAPNENFARELMELFLLGKEPTQNYTEADVQAGAKVLSGWRVASFTNPYPFVVNFVLSYHNSTNKTFSANFNSTVITGITGAGGSAEFDTYFDMLFQHQSVTIARYICRRLYRFFVYYDTDANIETNVIQPLAAALISNNWDMQPVVSMLLKSEHFYDMANRGVMIKSPIDLIAGVIRTLNINVTAAAGTSQLLNQYKVWENLQANTRNNMEQGFGYIPSVSGWKAYYQEPGYYQNWINANTIQKRANYLTSLVNGYTVSGTTIRIDGIAFVQQFPDTQVQDPDVLVNIFVRYLLPVDLPQTYKDELKTQNLLSGQVTNSYWTSAWNAFTANPTNVSNRTTVNNKLKALITALLQLAEFQLM